MSDLKNAAVRRLSQIQNFLPLSPPSFTIPLDPDSRLLPSRKNVPRPADAPEEAAWIWGANDNLGRLNLLTPKRVAAAGREIQTGEIVPVNLPLNVPAIPSFRRQPFEHAIKDNGGGLGFDDTYNLNTQSSTQWDGFRHVAHTQHKVFYNGVRTSDIVGPDASARNGIHHLAAHGIAGRGVLLDYWSYAQAKGIIYDPWEHYEISYSDLAACGRAQGLDIRPEAQGGHIKPGDMLFIRFGWKVRYQAASPVERDQMARRSLNEEKPNHTRFAGVNQEEAMLDWLHDSYFATVAGDTPPFEAWPSHRGYYLHEYLLAMWGVPIGELLDLERLAETCRAKRRWTFFFTSAPANCPNGVASHVNGTAIF